MDASGNSYITGSFAGATITFGSITLTNTGSAGTGDFFIAKYDASGNAVWAKGAGGGTLELGQCICIDGAGNIYAAGYFYGNMVFGSTTLINNGAGDIFIAKYDNSGNLIWAKSAGSSVNDEPAGICIDKNQNVLLTGHSYGNITFGSTVLTNAGDADVFLVKYDPSGNVIWAKNASGTSTDMGTGVCAAASGNIYISGWYTSPTMTIGANTLTNTSNTGNIADIFFAKYDNSGNVIWAKTVGGTADDYSFSTALDLNENVFITGSFSSTSLVFGGSTITNAGNSDVFIAKYNSGGTALWAKSAGAHQDERGSDLYADANGNVYLTGWYGSPVINFGGTDLTNIGGQDIYIVKYGPAGNVIWAKTEGGTSDEYSCGIAVDGSGNSFVTGFFRSSPVPFGNNNLTISGGTAVFTAKLNNSVGIDELSINNNGLRIYPNPVKEKIIIDISDNYTDGKLEIYNIIGAKVLTSYLDKSTGIYDISALSNGVYLIKVNTGDNILTGKFVKE